MTKSIWLKAALDIDFFSFHHRMCYFFPEKSLEIVGGADERQLYRAFVHV